VKVNQKIAYPDAVAPALERMRTAITLRQRGLIPSNIEAMMIAVPAKAILRAVYGSNFRAGWHMMIDTVKDRIMIRWTGLRFRLGWTAAEEKEWARELEAE
jgi:hypothetical protein